MSVNLSEMSLTDLMSYWKDLQTKIAPLEEEAVAVETVIQAEVMRLAATQKYNGVVASYTIGQGRYDYEVAALDAHASIKDIAMFTTPVIDWRKVCKQIHAPLEPFYTPGTPSVRVKLEKT